MFSRCGSADGLNACECIKAGYKMLYMVFVILFLGSDLYLVNCRLLCCFEKICLDCGLETF